MSSLRRRRIVVALIALIVVIFTIIIKVPVNFSNIEQKSETISSDSAENALVALEKLAIKGRAPKTDYSRDQFGGGWASTNGCTTRNIILNRDLTDVKSNDKCEVLSGQLDDPYTGKIIQFTRGEGTSNAIQIDHVVALSDAWQKGAQLLTSEQRKELANDPLELLAVDGPANQQKSDGDAATWLPPNKAFRCQYVARQIAVKIKYQLWVTSAEHDAIAGILAKCLNQKLPTS